MAHDIGVLRNHQMLGKEGRDKYAGRLCEIPPNPSDIWHLDGAVVTVGRKKQ